MRFSVGRGATADAIYRCYIDTLGCRQEDERAQKAIQELIESRIDNCTDNLTLWSILAMIHDTMCKAQLAVHFSFEDEHSLDIYISLGMATCFRLVRIGNNRVEIRLIGE